MDLKEKLEKLKTEKKTVGFVRPGGYVVVGTIEEIGEDFVTIKGKFIRDKELRECIVPFENLCLEIIDTKERR